MLRLCLLIASVLAVTGCAASAPPPVAPAPVPRLVEPAPAAPSLVGRVAHDALDVMHALLRVETFDRQCSERRSVAACRLAAALYAQPGTPWRSDELALVLTHEACLAGDTTACAERDAKLEREIDALDVATLPLVSSHQGVFCRLGGLDQLICRRAELTCERLGHPPERCRQKEVRPDPLFELELSAAAH